MEENERFRRLESMAGATSVNGKSAKLADAVCRKIDKQGWQSRQDFFCYVQWIAYQQWRAIKSYAEERGVALMGDIPFGVSYYSADVFARRG